jgi:hypothetical protein
MSSLKDRKVAIGGEALAALGGERPLAFTQAAPSLDFHGPELA